MAFLRDTVESALHTSTMGQPILDLINGGFNNRIFYKENSVSSNLDAKSGWIY